MAQAEVPVDLLNPGQVFACLGIAETAEVLLGGVRGGFDWSHPRTCRFRIEALGEESPVVAILRFLRSAEVRALVPAGTATDLSKWSLSQVEEPLPDCYSVPMPASPATLPAILVANGVVLRIDHWGDGTRRDKVKFWAGSGGYPGAALLRDALALLPEDSTVLAPDPFAFPAVQSSSFRFDWRRDYVPLGIGFSLNAHTDITPQGHPLVEILAAIGLTHARPQRPVPRNKLLYRYGVLGRTKLPLPLLRAGVGCAPLPFPRRTFRMTLDWPGKEGQARCITDVIEETAR
ncbi:MAG: type I-U CRISPR-associated protein Cas8c [Planctomycetes bacterium]|nr:type I-U CRISPR-associated protein Cas8c [Planctomycetota bacterium]